MKLTKNERLVWFQYHIPSCGNLNRLKVNCVKFSAANNKPHEMKKAEVCYDIQKKGQKFITEAQKGKGRIVDVVNLSTMEEIEIYDSSLTKLTREEMKTNKHIKVIRV